MIQYYLLLRADAPPDPLCLPSALLTILPCFCLNVATHCLYSLPQAAGADFLREAWLLNLHRSASPVRLVCILTRRAQTARTAAATGEQCLWLPVTAAALPGGYE